MKYFPTKLCFFFGTVGLIALRLLLLLVATDATTGFFYRNVEWCGWALTGYCLLFGLALAWYAFTDGFRYFSKPGLPSYIAALVTAVLLCVSVAFDFPLTGMKILGAALKLLAVFGFTLWGLAPFFKREISAAATLCFVPVWLYELFRTFVENNDVSAVPERIFDIVMLSLLLIAMLQTAKNAVGVMSKARKRFLLWVDYMAAAFCFAGVLPRYLMIVIGAGDQLHGLALSDPIYLAVGAYLMLYAMGSFQKRRPSAKP